MLTGPSPLLLHWRRRFCLQVSEAWPLIDHVWSCTTLLISACSSLVCLFHPTVPIITPIISCMICQLHASALTTSTNHTLLPHHQVLASTFFLWPSISLFLIKCHTLWLLLESKGFFPFCCLSFSLSLSLAAALALILQHQQVLLGMQQLSYTALINNTWQKYERARVTARVRERGRDWKFPLAGEQGVAHCQMLAFSRGTCTE